MPHPLSVFHFCPVCGSEHFEEDNEKSKRCSDCGFEYFLNPSSATAAFILNDHDELLAVTRKKEPMRGTLDLPGGFCDIGETAEEGVIREVMEETRLVVERAEYLFSYPNAYVYSGFEVPTMDMFFLCRVPDTTVVSVDDDADEYQWLPLDKIRIEEFGLDSIRKGLQDFILYYKNR